MTANSFIYLSVEASGASAGRSPRARRLYEQIWPFRRRKFDVVEHLDWVRRNDPALGTISALIDGVSD